MTLARIVAAVLLAASPAAADVGNFNIDYQLPCDGMPHTHVVSEPAAAISKIGWDILVDNRGILQWLVVARKSDAAYLLFAMSDLKHMREDYAPTMDLGAADAIEITGSCYSADRLIIKVQVWYVE